MKYRHTTICYLLVLSLLTGVLPPAPVVRAQTRGTPAIKRGLQFRLSEGRGKPVIRPASAPAVALPASDIERTLSRLPALK
ncbi:MAG: hypothetical protein ACKV2V_29185, partial [Blastocatellia bacterium]